MTVRRSAAVMAMTLIGGFAFGPPALAGGGHHDSGPVDGGAPGVDQPVVHVGKPAPDTIGVSVYSGARRTVGRGCSWQLIPVDTVRGRVPADADFIAGHHLYRRFDCDDPRYDTSIWIPIAPVETVLIPALLGYMRSRLPAPELVLEPLRPDGRAIVQLATDFRTTAETWRPVVVGASIGGPQPAFVTATASPVELEFVPGDPARPGETVSCFGADATAAYDPLVPGRCSYRYRNASSSEPSGRGFAFSLRIHWRVEFRSSDGPGTISVDPTESTGRLPVAEIKALATCVGVNC